MPRCDYLGDVNGEYGIVVINGDWAVNLHRERSPRVVFPFLLIKDHFDRSLAESRTVLAGHMPKGKPCGLGDSITKKSRTVKRALHSSWYPTLV